MSQFLFESPITLGVTAAGLVLMAAIAWIKTGSAAALYATLAMFLLSILLVSLNLQIQTDREKVESVLNQVAAAVQRNDLEDILKHMHSVRSGALARAKGEMPNYKFSEARITGIKKIEIAQTNPPSAIAEFNVAVSLTAHSQQFDGIRRFVRCYFLREGERWLVSDYEHFEPTHGFKVVSEQ